MDRLAAEGVRFTNGFTTSPLCVPARISLATGLYPHNSNLWQNDATLPTDADTYMNRLRAGGYLTATIGKNHLYPMENCDLHANEPDLHEVGFDHVEDLSGTWAVIGGTSVYTDWLARRGLLEPLRDYLRKLEAKPDEVRRYVAEPLPIPADDYIDAFIAQRVEQYLHQYDSARPSFVYVGFQGPHEPWDAPDCYAQRYKPDEIPAAIPELPPGEWLPPRSLEYQRWAQYYPPPNPQSLAGISARYFGKISQIDDSIGRILAAYERKGWLQDTVVIFTSDHGEMLGDLNRLSKSVFYESALRVPLVVRMPAGAGAGTTCPALVETIDVHATILEAAGCEIGPHKDCRSLLPLIGGEVEEIRRDVLGEVHAHYMLRTREWKLVVGRDGSTLQLFDLRRDPLEQSNLCGHPEFAAAELEMRSRLLGRITRDTLRSGHMDPEFSGHEMPENGDGGG